MEAGADLWPDQCRLLPEAIPVASTLEWGHRIDYEDQASAITALAMSPQKVHGNAMRHLLLLLPVLLSGCAIGVPANKINIVTPQGSYNIFTPKNVTITKFQAAVDTNGVVRVLFDSWISVNDPLVIDKSAAGQVAMINAWSGLLNQAVFAAANGAVQGATRP